MRWASVQAGAAISLCAMSIIPIGLTPVHDFLTLPIALRVGCLLALLLWPFAAWDLRRTRPLMALGIAWMFWSIVPRLFILTAPSTLNEHQFYTPLMGMVMIGVSLWR